MEKIKLAGRWKDAINNLQSSFYESEMNLQDQQINKTPGLGYTSNSINSAIPLAAPNKARASEELLNMLRQTKIGTSAPVVNTYLQNKTPEQYAQDEAEQLKSFGGILPAVGKRIGSRAFKFGNQFIDNIPGLSTMSTVTNDKADDIAGAAIQAGGRVLPILGAAWYGINAGPTAAATLDDARKKGLIK
jgi:hypothetical protein